MPQTKNVGVIIDEFAPRREMATNVLHAIDAAMPVEVFNMAFEKGQDGYNSRREWANEKIERICLRIAQLLTRMQIVIVIINGKTAAKTNFFSDLEIFLRDISPENRNKLKKILFSCWGDEAYEKVQAEQPTAEFDAVISFADTDRTQIADHLEQAIRKLLATDDPLVESRLDR